MPALRNSVQLEHRLKQEGLGVMLVGEGGTAGEGGGASPSSCGILQLVGVLGWDRCVGQLRQRGGDGRSGGTRDRFGEQSARPPAPPWSYSLAMHGGICRVSSALGGHRVSIGAGS